jgi:hypothetical protein
MSWEPFVEKAKKVLWLTALVFWLTALVLYQFEPTWPMKLRMLFAVGYFALLCVLYIAFPPSFL